MNDDSEEDRIESKAINDVVKVILILDHSKKPFKQNDVMGFLNNKPHRKTWANIFKEAKKRLGDIGLTLQEVQNTNAKSYFLTSKTPPPAFMHQHARESEVADRILLTLILALIFMVERPVSDVELFNHLEQLRIYNNAKGVHGYFGDVKKKIMTEFVSQLYLEKILDKETESIHFNWGERAHAEVSKKSILEFVCAIGYQGEIGPKNFVSQYAKVLEEEEVEKNGDAGVVDENE